MDRDFDRFRNDFQDLDWSRGFTRDDLQQRFPQVPRDWWQNVPSGQRFNNFNDFWHNFSSTGTGMTGSFGSGGTTFNH